MEDMARLILGIGASITHTAHRLYDVQSIKRCFSNPTACTELDTVTFSFSFALFSVVTRGSCYQSNDFLQKPYSPRNTET